MTITADAAPDGQHFKEWLVESGNISLESSTSATATFAMPAEAVSVKAVYEDNYFEGYTPKVDVPKKGTLLTDYKTKMVYKVMESGPARGKVQFVRLGNTKVRTVAVPDKVTIDGITYKVLSIAPNALKNNKMVTFVMIGKYVTSIGSSAFRNCTKLKKVTLGKSVATIGSKAFYKCRSLTSITIPSELKKSILMKYRILLAKRGVSKKVMVKSL